MCVRRTRSPRLRLMNRPNGGIVCVLCVFYCVVQVLYVGCRVILCGRRWFERWYMVSTSTAFNRAHTCPRLKESIRNHRPLVCNSKTLYLDNVTLAQGLSMRVLYDAIVLVDMCLSLVYS
jgi:hypothetical protein